MYPGTRHPWLLPTAGEAEETGEAAETDSPLFGFTVKESSPLATASPT